MPSSVATTSTQMTTRVQIARDLALAHAALATVITATIAQDGPSVTTGVKQLAQIARRLGAGELAAWCDVSLGPGGECDSRGHEARLPRLVEIWERTQAALVDSAFARELLHAPDVGPGPGPAVA